MVTASTDIGTNGRVVIPKKIRDAMNLKEGDTLFLESISNEEIRMRILRGKDEFIRAIQNPGRGRALDPGKLKEDMWG